MIVLNTVLTRDDYDAALKRPPALARWLSLVFWLVFAAGLFAMILPQMADVFSRLAQSYGDPAKWARLRESGVLVWVFGALIIVTPVALWFLGRVLRMTRFQLQQAWRPRDVRELPDGLYTGPAKFTISPGGLRMSTRDMRRMLPWSAFSQVVDDTMCVRLVYRNPGSRTVDGVCVPARLFADEEQRREFAHVCELFIREFRQ